MERELRASGDGSATLYVPALDETYHSTRGALTESKHVFLEAGLAFAHKQFGAPIRLLEIGLGTGLNALLSMIWAEERHVSVEYTALEPFPLSLVEVDSLGYAKLMESKEAVELEQAIHKVPMGEQVQLSAHFSLTKQLDTLQAMVLPRAQFHLIYFDAFAPSKQPELWTPELFAKLRASQVPGGILVTYSSSGTTKRALAEAGYQIERLAGPSGKRHMVRARNLGVA